MKLRQPSSDTRNSIFAWVIVLAALGLGWATIRLGWAASAPAWLDTALDIFAALGFAWFIFAIWRRRASNPKNPNRSSTPEA